MIFALTFAEAVRALVFRQAGRHGLMPLPEAFHRGNDAPHMHAHWLIEDQDDDGLADHMLLFAASGLPAARSTRSCQRCGSGANAGAGGRVSRARMFTIGSSETLPVDLAH